MYGNSKKWAAIGPNPLMANDMVLGTPMRFVFFNAFLDAYILGRFGANAKHVVKMRENAKTPRVKKWRIKVAYFSVCFGVFKFLAFASHSFRLNFTA